MAEASDTPMEVVNLITQLEGSLKAAISLRPAAGAPDNWLLEVRLMYGGDPAGKTSFSLNGYSREEAETVARTLRENAFIMKEIDEFLWGESD